MGFYMAEQKHRYINYCANLVELYVNLQIILCISVKNQDINHFIRSLSKAKRFNNCYISSYSYNS